MPKFVIYEVWTKHEVVEAEDRDQALRMHIPKTTDRTMNLANWHAVEVKDAKSK